MNSTCKLLVGTIGEGIWRSLDGGRTFQRLREGLFVECHVRALAAHPRDPRTLYLGSETGVFRSRDGGDRWELILEPAVGKEIWSIVVSPHHPDLIVVGTCPARLYRSENGGVSWSEPLGEILQHCPGIQRTRVTTLQADPLDQDLMWAGIEIDSLRRSRDAGRTWQPLGEGLSSRDIHALAIVPADGARVLLASTNNDVNRSTDDGQHWQPLDLPKALGFPYFRGMALRAGAANVLLLGCGDFPPGARGGIARSSDAGCTWTLAHLPAEANSTIWNFATHPANPDLLFASSVSGQIYSSTDAGLSWVKLPREFGEVRALMWLP